jgi:hypothetical protein
VAVDFIGQPPKGFLHMMKINPLASALEAVGDQVPNPKGTIGDHQHEFRR